MEFQALSAQHLGQSSRKPDFYDICSLHNHFYIMVRLGNDSFGFLIEERSGQLMRFVCRADAQRFCDGRNAAEKQRISANNTKGQSASTLHARRQTPEARRSTPKAQRSMAAASGEEVA